MQSNLLIITPCKTKRQITHFQRTTAQKYFKREEWGTGKKYWTQASLEPSGANTRSSSSMGRLGVEYGGLVGTVPLVLGIWTLGLNLVELFGVGPCWRKSVTRGVYSHSEIIQSHPISSSFSPHPTPHSVCVCASVRPCARSHTWSLCSRVKMWALSLLLLLPYCHSSIPCWTLTLWYCKPKCMLPSEVTLSHGVWLQQKEGPDTAPLQQQS